MRMPGRSAARPSTSSSIPIACAPAPARGGARRHHPRGPFRRSVFRSAEPPEMAWEERGILDADCFAAFGRKASDLLKPLEPDPVLRRWWPLAVERRGKPSPWACAGPGPPHARRPLRARDLRTAGERARAVADGDGLHRMAVAHSRLLHEAYNGALAAYRAAHRGAAADRGRCPISPPAPTIRPRATG